MKRFLACNNGRAVDLYYIKMIQVWNASPTRWLVSVSCEGKQDAFIAFDFEDSESANACAKYIEEKSEMIKKEVDSLTNSGDMS